MRNIAELNDVVAIKKFCFRNAFGGTSLSHWDHNEQYNGPAIVKIVKEWYDYETGQKYHAKPLNPELIEYLNRNGAIGLPKNGDLLGDEPREKDMKVKKDSVGELVIFVSEFDIDWNPSSQELAQTYKDKQPC